MLTTSFVAQSLGVSNTTVWRRIASREITAVRNLDPARDRWMLGPRQYANWLLIPDSVAAWAERYQAEQARRAERRAEREAEEAVRAAGRPGRAERRAAREALARARMRRRRARERRRTAESVDQARRRAEREARELERQARRDARRAEREARAALETERARWRTTGDLARAVSRAGRPTTVRQTVYRWVREGRIPAPTPVPGSQHVRGWPVDTYQALVAEMRAYRESIPTARAARARAAAAKRHREHPRTKADRPAVWGSVELAERWRVSVATVLAWESEGRLPPRNTRGGWSPEAIQALEGHLPTTNP
jgi:predicted DNA-binding transcriptional regulator AlpA